jgi:hypothetical protein
MCVENPLSCTETAGEGPFAERRRATVSAANDIRADRKPDCWTLDPFRPGLR